MEFGNGGFELKILFVQDNEFRDPYYMIFYEKECYGYIFYVDKEWQGTLLDISSYQSIWFETMSMLLNKMNSDLRSQRHNFWYQLIEFWNGCVDWIKSKFK